MTIDWFLSTIHWFEKFLQTADSLQKNAIKRPTMPKIAPDELNDMPTLSEMDGVRCLHFNSPWIQGAMQISNPANLVFLYTRQMMAWLLFLQSKDIKHISILGLGAGSLVRSCLKLTKANIDCVEWNPVVTEFCYQYFKLPRRQARLVIAHEDAQRWVGNALHHDKSQILLVDLYDYTAQGPVADSLAFYQNCYKVLSDIGIMVVNLFGHHPSYKKNINHIKSAFSDRVLVFDETEDGNRIVLAFKGPALQIQQEDLIQRAKVVQRYTDLEGVQMANELIKEWEKQRKKIKVSPNVLYV